MKKILGWDGVGGVAMLTVGRAAQASLLGAKKVKLPGPSISGLSLARSEYIWVVVAPITARVLQMLTRGSAAHTQGRVTGMLEGHVHTCVCVYVCTCRTASLSRDLLIARTTLVGDHTVAGAQEPSMSRTTHPHRAPTIPSTPLHHNNIRNNSAPQNTEPRPLQPTITTTDSGGIIQKNT